MAYLYASTLSSVSAEFHANQPTATKDMDADTAALIARLALEDIEEFSSGGRKGKSRAASASAEFHPNQPTATNDMNADTAALIARLALEDVEEFLTGGGKGNSRADAPLSDKQYAYKLQMEIQASEDAKYAKRLEDAWGTESTDAAFLEAVIIAEEAAMQDRRAAEMASRGEALPPPTAAQRRLENPFFVMHPAPPVAHSAPTPDTVTEDRFSVKVVNSLKDSESNSDDWSTRNSEELDERFHGGLKKCTDWIHGGLEEYTDWDLNASLFAQFQKNKSNFDANSSAPGPSVNRNKLVECAICQDDTLPYSKALHTPCDHDYCGECVTHLVESFIRDESLFPLRCCKQPIPITDIDHFISPTLRAEFLKKHAEFSVLSKDRLYCFEPTCSTFLGSTTGLGISGVVCPTCSRATCPRCKQAQHIGEDCVVNAATLAVRALGKEQGWQICPQCDTMVELSFGCYHMICRCQAQFCYLCAVPWKDCECEQWDEARLIETAQQRTENKLGARAVGAMPQLIMEEHVRLRIEVLRENHHCERHVWGYRDGGGACQECNFHLNRYLLICAYCSFLACVRCARNRL